MYRGGLEGWLTSPVEFCVCGSVVFLNLGHKLLHLPMHSYF